jgi:hypothetical protein
MPSLFHFVNKPAMYYFVTSHWHMHSPPVNLSLFPIALACSPRVWYIDGSRPDQIKPKTIKLVFAASPLLKACCIKEKEQILVSSESG